MKYRIIKRTKPTTYFERDMESGLLHRYKQNVSTYYVQKMVNNKWKYVKERQPDGISPFKVEFENYKDAENYIKNISDFVPINKEEIINL